MTLGNFDPQNLGNLTNQDPMSLASGFLNALGYGPQFNQFAQYFGQGGQGGSTAPAINKQAMASLGAPSGNNVNAQQNMLTGGWANSANSGNAQSQQNPLLSQANIGGLLGNYYPWGQANGRWGNGGMY